MSTQITTAAPRPVIDNVSILTNGDLFDRLMAIANVMANSGVMVPEHFRGKPEACMAVSMQAARWGMDPFAVAQKTHIVSGTLGYEAQLVNAVVTTMAPTKDRLHYEWFGPWENVIGKFVEKTSQKGNKYIAPAWSLADEKGIGVRVWATMHGENEPRLLELFLSQAQVRNSTLWASDPRQQLAYLAVKRWARLYCPDVILGVYSADELEDSHRPEKDITPPPERVTAAQLAETPAHKPAPAEPGEDVEKLAADIRQRIEAAANCDDTTALRQEIEQRKRVLGAGLYTELKNKTVQRHRQHQSDATALLLTDAINSISAPEDFAAAEALVNQNAKILTPEALASYRQALDDMRPEYQQ